MEFKEIKKNVKKSYYQVSFHYEILNDDLKVKDKIKVSIDNPYLERFVDILNSIECDEKIILTEHQNYGLSDEDLEFFDMIVHGDRSDNPDSHNYVSKNNEKFIEELEFCVKGDMDIYWLIFKKVKVKKIVY